MSNRRAAAILAMLRASFPRAMMASLTAPVTASAGTRWMASISAERSSRDPCQVTRPVADLSLERIKRRPVLGGLINEYERTA